MIKKSKIKQPKILQKKKAKSKVKSNTKVQEKAKRKPTFEVNVTDPEAKRKIAQVIRDLERRTKTKFKVVWKSKDNK